ncbi:MULTISPECIES: DNA-directed RNA polymerase subunit alpha [Desulfovibrio]|jgi:DNA-directed RNA polymerase, alpha subunit, bacterial and chloroplast-type|uniref:DNA-directed RNA polymerase subunit alpha n=1 Tax=Desulfovibrio TaxID=872 RepID=UPI002CF48D3F|nr:DNA-directed RNA polymerase subunit alpha [Desulfovibrio sp.]HMM37826.1 DNA-directed RNA polymerase subunit alpha [Desulfovibrio sp.]
MLIQHGDKLINARNWSELVRPEQLVRDPKSTDTYGKFVCEPLERGFATTIGNAMRRVLLSSLQGAAIVAARIEGVQHEFTTVQGVLEDITEVVLNLKQVRLGMTSTEPQILVLEAKTKGPVTAAMIRENQNVRVLNADQIICTLTEDRPLKMELEVRMGKGYMPAEMHEGLTEDIGLITLDASYSPVRKVAYSVEQARVGQMTNYDKLILEVWTDGSVPPEDACAYSAKILKDQLSVFINFDELSSETEKSSEGGADINPNLFKGIDELELSVRATNCLKAANIQLVGELVQRTEQAMLKTKNFGRKSLDEIRRVLDNMGLRFGMSVDDFDKKYQEWLKRKEKNEA